MSWTSVCLSCLALFLLRKTILQFPFVDNIFLLSLTQHLSPPLIPLASWGPANHIAQTAYRCLLYIAQTCCRKLLLVWAPLKAGQIFVSPSIWAETVLVWSVFPTEPEKKHCTSLYFRHVLALDLEKSVRYCGPLNLPRFISYPSDCTCFTKVPTVIAASWLSCLINILLMCNESV